MVSIVPITAQDRPSLRVLELLCIREYVETVMKRSWDQISAEVREKVGGSASASFEFYKDTGLSFVAKEGDKVIGFIFAQMVHHIDSVPNVVWIENVGVDPEYRRMSIGYLLMRKVAEEGKKKGAQIVHSSISIDNTKSLLLHRKLGFLAETRKVAVLDLENFR